MKRQLLVVFSIFFLVFFLGAKNVLACDISFTPSSVQSGQSLRVATTYTKTFPNDPNQMSFTVTISYQGSQIATYPKTLTSGVTDSFMAVPQASPGRYEATAINSSQTDHCNNFANATQAPPPGTTPPPGSTGNSPIGTPNTWLSLINPGFGIPKASGGLGFVMGNIIPFAINMLLSLVIVGALLFTVWGGIMWITSRGEKEGLAKAKGTITWAIVGLILAICSFIIIGLFGRLLGTNFNSNTDSGLTCTVSSSQYSSNCLITGPLTPGMQQWCNLVKSACGY